VKNGLDRIAELSPIGFARYSVPWKAKRRARDQRSLSREIGAALAFKAVALTLIYLLFFSGSRAPVVTPSEMAGFLPIALGIETLIADRRRRCSI